MCWDGTAVCLDGDTVCWVGAVVCWDGAVVCWDGHTMCWNGCSVFRRWIGMEIQCVGTHCSLTLLSWSFLPLSSCIPQHLAVLWAFLVYETWDLGSGTPFPVWVESAWLNMEVCPLSLCFLVSASCCAPWRCGYHCNSSLQSLIVSLKMLLIKGKHRTTGCLQG